MTDKKQRIFAYLRKSTNKDGQRDSIDRQEDYVRTICKRDNLNFNKVEFFIDEGYSGYKGSRYKNTKSQKVIRKRPEFQRMLNEAKKCSIPCKILTWNIARFARNTIESGEITNMLGDNIDQDIRVEGVYFLDGKKWLHGMSELDIQKDITIAQQYSEDLSNGAIQRKQSALEAGLLGEIRAPKGLMKNSKTKKLQETEDMECIRQAFEMKAQGHSNKDIHAYLTTKGIKITKCNMHTVLFSNTTYIGYYIDKSTGEIFDLKYTKGKQPIDQELFDKANGNIGKKRGKYGDKQKRDLLANLLRTTNGRKLSAYVPKGRKAKQYQNATEKVYVSQGKVFDEFEDVIGRICYIYYLVSIYGYLDGCDAIGGPTIDNKTTEQIRQETDQLTYETFREQVELQALMNFMLFMPYYVDYLFSDMQTIKSKKDRINMSKVKEGEEKTAFTYQVTKIMKSRFGIKTAEDEDKFIAVCTHMELKTNHILRELILNKGHQGVKKELENIESYIIELENEKKKMDLEVKNIEKNALIIGGYTRETIDDMTKEHKDNIKELDNQIIDLRENNIAEQDLDRFIDSILDIFEHIGDMRIKGKDAVSEEDMLHLIKLTTFELKINPSKSIDIELFEGLKKVFYCIGIPTENGTPISALRRPHPNH